MTDATAATDTDVLHHLARLLNDAAHNPALHQHLLTDPRAALAEAGLPIGDAVAVTARITPPAEAAAVAARSTPDRLILPVPPLASGTELGDAELEAVAGGGAFANMFSNLLGAVRNAFAQVFGKKVDISGAVAQYHADAQAARGNQG
ncbi:hypothetical protein V6768_10820 [Tistrella mobilis]